MYFWMCKSHFKTDLLRYCVRDYPLTGVEWRAKREKIEIWAAYVYRDRRSKSQTHYFSFAKSARKKATKKQTNKCAVTFPSLWWHRSFNLSFDTRSSSSHVSPSNSRWTGYQIWIPTTLKSWQGSLGTIPIEALVLKKYLKFNLTCKVDHFFIYSTSTDKKFFVLFCL